MTLKKFWVVFVVMLASLLLVACMEPPPAESHLEFPMTDAGDGCIRVLIVKEEFWSLTENADLREEFQAAVNSLEYDIVGVSTVYNQHNRMVAAEIYYRVPNCP